MTSLKTMAATAVVAVGGTVAAFSGLHLGQAPAAAATAQPAARPVKAAATYTINMSAKDVARVAALLNGQQARATTLAHHSRRTQHRRDAATRAATRTMHATAESFAGVTHYAYDHGGDRSYAGGSHDGSQPGGGCD